MSRYVKKNHLDHVLHRSDMYVGSLKLREMEDFVSPAGEDRIVKKTLRTSPGLLRIFVEPLSNAIDNVERSKNTVTPCTKISVFVDIESGKTSVWNDGDIVPVEKNETEGCYNHTLIFGHLLTGSNYDDSKDRIVSGKNGLGVKLTSIFSTNFSVKGCDPINKKSLYQEWEQNMKVTNGPKITKSSSKKGYTEVTWYPDFKRFGIPGYSKDIVSLYKRYVVDTALLSGVNVYFNGEKLKVPSLSKYAKFFGEENEQMIIKYKECEVLVTPSKEYEFVSFVNGVYTRLGGLHVEEWTKAILKPLLSKINKKGKPSLTIRDVKPLFRFFIIATVIRPEFDGQDKNKLESPSVKTRVSAKNIKSVLRWKNTMEKIGEIIRQKEMMTMKKTERKSSKFQKIEGLDPANKAGTKFSGECTLILCEGLSAKTYAVAGIDKGWNGKKGRDWFGIYPLRGKILNVRNASTSVITKNRIINDLIKAIGLKHGVDYKKQSNFSKLAYGKIMILCDADVDGIHIEGLIINFFHTLFPTLLERKESYIISMKTPIVRIIEKGQKKDILFYDENNYKTWAEKTKRKNVNAKYYKGLGTTKAEDVPDTFGKKIVSYTLDSGSTFSMDKIFKKDKTNERKEWLANKNKSDKKGPSLDNNKNNVDMGISDFVDNEMIKFSRADCSRSLPNIIDGLKESQRKILYAVKKRKLGFKGKSLKVAQLGAYAAEHSNYHHGEQNMFDTIIKMAQDFPGSNNIPLFYRDGQFGCRLEGGKDAASARYIYTKMDRLTEVLFPSADDELLDYVIDDGEKVEPTFYIPIIPMILINGCSVGIGTGWSCNVPCYNPIDIIEAVRQWIDQSGTLFIEDEDEVISTLAELTPWYRHFKGTITKASKNKYESLGKLKEESKGTIVVEELPINLWTNKFKENCENLLEKKLIKSIKNYSTTTDVKFVIKECPNGIKCNASNLGIKSNIYTSNMVLIGESGKIERHSDIDEIIEQFCNVRLQCYQKRLKVIIQKLQNSYKLCSNKYNFIHAVIEKKIKIMRVKEEIVVKRMEELLFQKVDGNFSYLLKLPVRSFTKEKLDELNKERLSIKKELEKMEKTEPENLWLKELDNLEKIYNKYY